MKLPEASGTFTIVNELGLHARAAAQLAQTASQFQSELWLSREGEDEEVNGKSIMGILVLAAACQTRIRVRVVGPDCREALAAVAALIEDGFGDGGVS